MSATALDLRIRPFAPADEPEVLGLLGATLGGGPAGERTPAFFRWKHLENPFGPSLMLLGEVEGRIVGLRAFLRWRLREGDRSLRAVRAVDTATHPDHQGRGIFSTLTREALAQLEGQADLVFNTPNDRSLPGYLKMGWMVVGRVPVQVRPRRPVTVALGLRSLGSSEAPRRPRPQVDAPPAGEVLADERGVTDLLQRSEERHGAHLSTPRDVAFLRWRYGEAPVLDYRAIAEERGGEFRGLALFRVRPRGRLWETTVSEILAARGDGVTVRRLLRRVGRSAGVDHVTARLPAGASPARSGFLPSPMGPTLVVNPLGHSPILDPTDPRRWRLALGDVEVF